MTPATTPLITMFTHDNPAPAVSQSYFISQTSLPTGHWINIVFSFSAANLGEEELAPNWYDTGASKLKKRKLSAFTKDLEKRKKAATSVDAEDETLVENIPLKR